MHDIAMIWLWLNMDPMDEIPKLHPAGGVPLMDLRSGRLG